jgi:DNA-directed RNA polymerase specialized sigma24 family protein
MPEVRRRSFLLNRLQGLSCAAIARMTGYSESAVKKHIDLALKDLEAALSDAERVAGNDRA